MRPSTEEPFVAPDRISGHKLNSCHKLMIHYQTDKLEYWLYINHVGDSQGPLKSQSYCTKDLSLIYITSPCFKYRKWCWALWPFLKQHWYFEKKYRQKKKIVVSAKLSKTYDRFEKMLTITVIFLFWSVPFLKDWNYISCSYKKRI